MQQLLAGIIADVSKGGAAPAGTAPGTPLPAGDASSGSAYGQAYTLHGHACCSMSDKDAPCMFTDGASALLACAGVEGDVEMDAQPAALPAPCWQGPEACSSLRDAAQQQQQHGAWGAPTSGCPQAALRALQVGAHDQKHHFLFFWGG
jgi:hypothetical protein